MSQVLVSQYCGYISSIVFSTSNLELSYHSSGLGEQMCNACIYPLSILSCLNTEQISFVFRVRRGCLMLKFSYNKHFAPAVLKESEFSHDKLKFTQP